MAGAACAEKAGNASLLDVDDIVDDIDTIERLCIRKI